MNQLQKLKQIKQILEIEAENLQRDKSKAIANCLEFNPTFARVNKILDCRMRLNAIDTELGMVSRQIRISSNKRSRSDEL